jgi:hypothetical protein
MEQKAEFCSSQPGHGRMSKDNIPQREKVKAEI